MLYSVWNKRSRRFDYYETPRSGPTHAPAATHVGSRSSLGATPEEAAWPLPAGARRVGHGTEVRGQVAKIGGGLAMGDAHLGSTRAVALAGGLLLAAIFGRRYLR